MDAEALARIQRSVAAVRTPHISSLHEFEGVPSGFKPWESGLSPSALYNCSLGCRKKMGIKTPEVKWMSIKRWVTKSPEGVDLPPGVYLSIKRREDFEALPKPRLVKLEFTLMMFQYGNVWSQRAPDVPITEEWLWSDVGGMTALEALMRRDAALPVRGYFASCHRFAAENPDQIGIHLKRQRRVPDASGT